MGCCFSSNGKTSKKTIVENIRVVHQNGYLQIFEDTVTVGEVTSNLPKHFMCTPAQLLVSGILPLRPDIELKPGHIYFCLPYSTLQFEVSPGDLATMAKKLMNIARNGVSLSKSPSGSQDGVLIPSPDPAPASTYQLISTKRSKSTKGKNNRYAGSYSGYKVPSEEPSGSPYRSSPMRSGSDSPGRSPSRFSDRYVIGEGENVGDLDAASRSPMWKPKLATIREKSFNRRSESDLQESGVQIPDSNLQENRVQIPE